MNSRAGYETDPHLDPTNKTTKRQRVAIVGAGPADLTCSTTAAERGHDVTLFDNADEIGGQFNMAKRIPGKFKVLRDVRTIFGSRFKTRVSDLQLNRYVNENAVPM